MPPGPNPSSDPQTASSCALSPSASPKTPGGRSTAQEGQCRAWDAEGESAVFERVEVMESEPQEGNVEYKLMLLSPSEERLEHLVTQMLWRLAEGQGEAIYEIGVEDDGSCTGLSPQDLEESLVTLRTMASRLNAHVTPLRNIEGKKGKCAEVLVRKIPEEGAFRDLRVAVVGNVDSGKSTIIGVLTSGRLDNGRGLARSNVFRHRHELESGRTSSISQQIMGLDLDGRLVNDGCVRDYSWGEIVERSAKVVTFIDLAGHEKYIKTTVTGMTGSLPGYAMVVIGANMGVLRMTREHLGVALALKLPLIFVVTKIDMCPPNILQQTIDDLSKILRSPGVRKMPLVVRGEGDVVTSARSLSNDHRVAPIFLTSSVTGADLNLVRMLLNLLPPRTENEAPDSPGEFHIDDTFQVTGVGAVVAGTMLSGEITIRSNLVMGPDSLGKFVPVQIKSIMNKRLPVVKASTGQSATFAVKKFKRNQFRKGMIVADAALNPRACLRFTAEVVVLHHHTTISNNYQPVVHCLTVTQSCRVVGMKDGPMRTGDRSSVDFEFLYRPEYLVLGSRMIFREGRTKGIGKIVAITYLDGETATLQESTTLPSKAEPVAPLKRTAPTKSGVERVDISSTSHPVASECA
mmetsp:Transcript_45150/g.113152  ORF Transcript_45150/g.113152 Transcript_45150/m.113152 type:complete len:632 (-) Transcript_45150:431-2326(-)|eukprot:CAMPEP_0173462144 /NCGR_PEP_ID=MMETSP1357-20121228/66132_1 /TAXON_ID=77926 /ORGANISM="Hemiselmis rufescens, Strain PCC563" /LENGTH=631 /DNA_ID=CAMNT_0014429857 /DNA_START=32 /DNA_END=1927 /DNA_ORIENTATION=+